MKTNTFNLIYALLNNKKLFEDNTEEGINFLNRKFPDYKEYNTHLFNEIRNLTNNYPISFLHLTQGFLKDNKSLTKLLSKIDLITKDVRRSKFTNKLEFISLFWEISDLLRFHAFILSGMKEDFNNLSSSDNILKHFKPLGISGSLKNKARQIRNAYSHKYTLKEGILIDKDNKEICSEEDVIIVYNALKKVYLWCLISYLMVLYYNKKHLVLMGIIFYVEVSKDTHEFVDYYSIVKTVFPEGVELSEQKQREIASNQNVISRINNRLLQYYKNTVLRRALIRYNPMIHFSFDTFKKLFRRFEDRSLEFVILTEQLKANINLEEYSLEIEKIKNGLADFKIEMYADLKKEIPSTRIIKFLDELAKER